MRRPDRGTPKTFKSRDNIITCSYVKFTTLKSLFSLYNFSDLEDKLIFNNIAHDFFGPTVR